ncbi:hypothetical protein BAZMOX_54488_1 [methanotrophic endosymbiont of Bathymodiolus azoricus (Menez Gwen)]|nr:hypothetical protein BAZMOX_54488_1 [methanotrophic endosymbiont of Bathymodiolus azoricus (Menez Gwen)]
MINTNSFIALNVVDKYCLHNLQELSKLRNEYLSKLSKLFVYNS